MGIKAAFENIFLNNISVLFLSFFQKKSKPTPKISKNFL